MLQVSVAVLTYRRNDDLSDLLPLLLTEIDSAEDKVRSGLAVEVLVVDNDPDGAAASVVRPFEERSPVRYVNETHPGIAAARNRALDEAHPEGLVVFIDDDERPVAGWLTSLLTMWEEHRSAAVGGPVQASFTGEIDPWIAAGGFFERGFHNSFRSGTAVKVAPTGNILLNLAIINAHGLRFDTTLGLAGGEDTLFTRQLVGLGEEIIWCGDAVVLDPVPPERLTRRWVITRVFFVANASIHASIKLAGSWLASLPIRLRYGATGTARIAMGAAQAVAGTLTRNQRLQARGIRRAARGSGALAAVLGRRFEEYRRH